jgi:rhamnosyl/mannosyltransferase
MISCEIGSGTSFANIDGETGFVVSPESPDDLATAMSSLLADNTMAEEFGRSARRRYEEFFSEAALGTAYSRLYQDMLRYQD